MQRFILGPLDQWQRVKANEILGFPATGPRRIKLGVIGNGPFEVHAGLAGDDLGKLVGVSADGTGQIEVQFTAEGESWVMIVANEADDLVLFVRGYAPDHRVAAGDVVKYTNVEPRVRRNSEVDRMVLAMAHNEKVRKKQYDAMLARLEASERAAAEKASSQVIEKEPPAPPAAEGGGDEE